MLVEKTLIGGDRLKRNAVVMFLLLVGLVVVIELTMILRGATGLSLEQVLEYLSVLTALGIVEKLLMATLFGVVVFEIAEM
ncbi:MAG: hypothetical protein ACE5IO_06150 [Thermoplasmata archaeon]